VSELEAAFVRDGDLLIPRPFTESGWTPNTLMGRYLAGLVAWSSEQHGDDDLQPARLTVDMFRPATMAPTTLKSTVVRDGRRIKVVDTAVLVDGAVVCRGSTVFLRRSGEPRGATWLPPEWSVAEPDDLELTFARSGWQPEWDQRLITPWDSITVHRRTWLRETRPFVEGEPLTPLIRAALAADNASGQVNGGPLGMAYINADLTLTLARLPEGEWLGLDAISRAAADGVSVGTMDLYDNKGRIGQVTLIAVADERNVPAQ
jgi:hypothetical protein